MQPALEHATSLGFAAAARRLLAETRRLGLAAPGFRSPPRLLGADRSLRRRRDGGATIAVRIRGRPMVAVLADMIEGVVVANGLRGPRADRTRTALWEVMGQDARNAA